VTPLQAARGHLAKAQEFLAEAKSALARFGSKPGSGWINRGSRHAGCYGFPGVISARKTCTRPVQRSEGPDHQRSLLNHLT
jgi:hypothetical protein